MVIESVAAAGMILQQINTVIQNVNEGKANVQTAMGLLSEFGQGLNEFQSARQASTFKPLSNNDVLKLQMIRRSQERYEKDLRDLLLVADPQLLEAYDAAIKENKRQHREHLKLMAKKRKQKEVFMAQLAVTIMTLVVGGGIAIGVIALVIKAYG